MITPASLPATPELIPPRVTAIRSASVGYGLWPWSKGPLWRLEEPWAFQVLMERQPSGAAKVRGFTIPKGYEFDKASIPSILWGFPLNYTPDGPCAVPALEHDFLCDLYTGGSAWLKERLGELPPSPSAEVIHRHFYDRLLQWKERPSKARTMYMAVRNFGPGGRARPSTWFSRGVAAP